MIVQPVAYLCPLVVPRVKERQVAALRRREDAPRVGFDIIVKEPQAWEDGFLYSFITRPAGFGGAAPAADPFAGYGRVGGKR